MAARAGAKVEAAKPAKAGASTRERVLDVALALFNARGFLRVTTAEIAEAAGINEGNLYYWFRRKDQIAQALFGRFEVALVAVAEAPIGDPAVLESYAAYQRRWFGLMTDFRFLYRDGPALRALAPAMLQPLQALNVRGQAALRRVFGEMVAHGVMRASSANIEVLIGNLWIVSAYWMDYRAVETGEELGEADFAWGFRQVEMLTWPYLALTQGRPAGVG